MSQRFVKYHPMVRKSERERLMLVGAAGLTCLLLTVFIFVLHNRSEANVPKDMTPEVTAEAARPAIHGVTLLAPVQTITAGTKLSSIELKEIYWPRNRVPEGAIRDAAEIKNLYANANLMADQPLVRSSLTTKPSRTSVTIRPGFRAITVELDANGTVDQLAQPGTFVDVLLTFEKEGLNETKILVQNVRVLSFSGEIEEQVEAAMDANTAARLARSGRSRQSSSTISLEVSVEDALKIQTAKTMGRLGLMLRPPEEAVTANGTDSVDANTVADGKKRTKTAKNNSDCNKGRIKVSGREFILGCNGDLSQVADPYDP